MSKYQIKIYQNLNQINRDVWNSLNESNFPFQSFEWHHALNSSQSIGETRGQWPYYICLYDKNTIVGILPCFIKNNSYGEYLFDWQWANHFEMNGIAYYPKLLAYTPYTPIIGPKFLIQNNEFYQF